MNGTIYCPWCMQDVSEHKGRRCPEMSNILVESFRAAFQADRAARDQELAMLVLRDSTRVVKVDSSGPAMVLSAVDERGVAMIRNADAANVFFTTDERNATDPLKRATILAGKAIFTNTPGDLYVIGSVASPGFQLVEVVEFPPGRGSSFASIG